MTNHRDDTSSTGNRSPGEPTSRMGICDWCGRSDRSWASSKVRRRRGWLHDAGGVGHDAGRVGHDAGGRRLTTPRPAPSSPRPAPTSPRPAPSSPRPAPSSANPLVRRGH